MNITNILYIEDRFNHYNKLLKGFKSRYEVTFFPVDKEDRPKEFEAFFKEKIIPIFNLQTDEDDINIHQAEDIFRQFVIEKEIHLIIIDVELGIDDTKSEGGILSDLLSDMKIPIVFLTIGLFSNYSYIVKKTNFDSNLNFIIDQIILKANQQIAPEEYSITSKTLITEAIPNSKKANENINNEEFYNKKKKIIALSSLFGKESLDTDIAYINLLRTKEEKKPFSFKNGYNFQIITISWIQYLIEFFCILFLLLIACTSLYKLTETLFCYLYNKDPNSSNTFIGGIISGIEYLFLAPLPYLISVGYLRTYTLRHPLNFDRKFVAFERLQEKKFFIGSLIGIVATNLVKVLLNLPNNYFVWRAIFINLIFPILAHIAVISVLIYFYNKLSKKHH